MNIVIPDIDTYMIDFADLHTMAILQQVNKYFNKIITAKPIMRQWKVINNMQLDLPNDKFIEACKRGFLAYAKYLFGAYEIDIHANNDYAFQLSCENGHIEVAQWLILLGESNDYTKIDIHADNEYAFRWSCQYGHLELAQWLIKLGESNGYTKINIHADNEYAFRWSCRNGHLEVAQWLVNLGESSGYTKIDIHANNDYAFRWSRKNGYLDLAQWLVKLNKTCGCGKFNQKLIKN